MGGVTGVPGHGALQIQYTPDGFAGDWDDAGAPSPSAADLVGVVGMLRRVSRTIDLRWRTEMPDAGGETASRLAEASQGVHRALIALTALDDVAPPGRAGR